MLKPCHLRLIQIAAQSRPYLAIDWHSMHHKCQYFRIFGQCDNDSLDDTDHSQAVRMPRPESRASASIHHTKYQYRWADYADWTPTEFTDHRRSLHRPAKHHISNVQHASVFGCPAGHHSNELSPSYST